MQDLSNSMTSEQRDDNIMADYFERKNRLDQNVSYVSSSELYQENDESSE